MTSDIGTDDIRVDDIGIDDIVLKLMRHQQLFGNVHPFILFGTKGTLRGVSGEVAGSNRRKRLYLRALLESAGLSPEAARDMVVPLRRAHDAFNLWRRVPPHLGPALARLRSLGFRVAIVSNSEGRLLDVFTRVGLGEAFELVVDSHFEGVRKPDPEIFRRALSRLGVEASRAVYLGDIPGVDVAGAHAAGMKAVLVDALGFYVDHTASPRVESVSEFVERYVEGPRRVRVF